MYSAESSFTRDWNSGLERTCLARESKSVGSEEEGENGEGCGEGGVENVLRLLLAVEAGAAAKRAGTKAKAAPTLSSAARGTEAAEETNSAGSSHTQTA